MFVFVIAFWIVVAVLGAAVKWYAGRRTRQLGAVAARLGLEFTPTDMFGLIDHTFDLFNLHDGAKVGNVTWGKWHGVEVWAADLWFATEPDGGQPGTGMWANGSRVAAWMSPYTFATARIDAFVPRVVITRATALDRADAILGSTPIRFESERFNRLYTVTSDDREFAFRFVDVRLMQWLLDVAATGEFGFEANGSRIVVWCRDANPSVLPALLTAAAGFHDRVPRLVRHVYR